MCLTKEVAAVAVWKKKMDTKKAMKMASSSFTMPSTARTIDLRTRGQQGGRRERGRESRQSSERGSTHSFYRLLHSLPPSLTYSLLPSLTPSLPHSLNHLLPPSLPRSLTHSVSQSVTQSVSHSVSQSVTHSLTHSLTQSLIHSLSHSLTHSVTHPAGPLSANPDPKMLMKVVVSTTCCQSDAISQSDRHMRCTENNREKQWFETGYNNFKRAKQKP
jgi:hypothetical protein